METVKIKLGNRDNKPYKNKEWLEYQYVGLQKSSCDIEREFGFRSSVILRWLPKLKIPTRDLSLACHLARGLHVNLSNEALEVLHGLLLGDGHLDFKKWSSYLTCGSKFRGFLAWLSEELFQFGLEQCGRITNQRCYFKKTKKHGISFYYTSRSYTELKPLQKKWYRPANEEEKEKGRKFIKIVPPDLRLTPTICLHWYIG